MITTRLITPGDAAVLADLVVGNREFLAPWEPVRPDSYFTYDGQAEAIAESLERYERGQQVPRVILDEIGAVVGRINLNNVLASPVPDPDQQATRRRERQEFAAKVAAELGRPAA